MGLIEAYKRYLLLEHNREFYKHNTFLIRFFKSETDIEEIFDMLHREGLSLLVIVVQLDIFFKINIFIILWIYLSIFAIFSVKLMICRILYKGFNKPIFKCLDCEKMTKITLDNCQHCGSAVHKNQMEYFKKKKEVIIKKRWNRINTRDMEEKKIKEYWKSRLNLDN